MILYPFFFNKNDIILKIHILLKIMFKYMPIFIKGYAFLYLLAFAINHSNLHRLVVLYFSSNFLIIESGFIG